MMEWRIVETTRGFDAQYGAYIKPQTAVGFIPGFFMQGFNVSESARFDTQRQAEKYIERRKKEGRK